jgi:hypothetical protein
LGVDGYGGAFAEAPGHRIGKAMAAEPSPTDGCRRHLLSAAVDGAYTACSVADFDFTDAGIAALVGQSVTPQLTLHKQCAGFFTSN